jgi:hypothetical protein
MIDGRGGEAWPAIDLIWPEGTTYICQRQHGLRFDRALELLV